MASPNTEVIWLRKRKSWQYKLMHCSKCCHGCQNAIFIRGGSSRYHIGVTCFNTAIYQSLPYVTGNISSNERLHGLSLNIWTFRLFYNTPVLNFKAMDFGNYLNVDLLVYYYCRDKISLPSQLFHCLSSCYLSCLSCLSVSSFFLKDLKTHTPSHIHTVPMTILRIWMLNI